MCSELIETKLLSFLNAHPDIFRNLELFQLAFGFEQSLKKLAYFNYQLGSQAIAMDKAGATPGIQQTIPTLMCWTVNPRYKRMFVKCSFNSYVWLQFPSRLSRVPSGLASPKEQVYTGVSRPQEATHTPIALSEPVLSWPQAHELSLRLQRHPASFCLILIFNR